MSKPNHLLPCPFCGQVDRVVEHTNSVECERCNVTLTDKSRDGFAHLAWNDRYADKATQEVHRLKGIFYRLNQYLTELLSAKGVEPSLLSVMRRVDKACQEATQ